MDLRSSGEFYCSLQVFLHQRTPSGSVSVSGSNSGGSVSSHGTDSK